MATRQTCRVLTYQYFFSMINYKSLPSYGKIIYVTIAVYAFTQLWKLAAVLFCWSGYDWSHWLALPANLNDFALRPWTLLSYMFCHANLTRDPFHILFNMLWLWWFGQFFMRNHTSKQMVSFYICSGMVAGLFFLFCYNIFPYFSLDRYYTEVVGASGAIFALIVAVAIERPDEVLGLNLFVKVVWIRMKWLALVVLGINLLCYRAGNDGGLVCHIGGAIFGALYAMMERKGKDITAWPAHLFEIVNRWIHDLRRPRMTATRGGKREPISADKKRDMDYNAAQKNSDAQIDAILDKISRQGYNGLTAEEKQLLFDASKRKSRRK